VIGTALGVFAVCAEFAVVDPQRPTDRAASTMGDCGSSVVLDAGSPLFPHPGVTVAPESASPDDEDLHLVDLTKPEPVAPPAAVAACVLFMSGFTGLPKGAVIPHRASFRIFHHGGFARLNPGTVFLHAVPPCQDTLALEIFGALMNSGCVVPAGGRLRDPGNVRRVVARRGVNTAGLTASLFNVLVNEELDASTSLRAVLIGDERLLALYVSGVLSAHPDTHLTIGYVRLSPWPSDP
jgi:non-ribosomal peptide synthetase component F